MKHPENDYIQAGYRYERASTANDAIAQAQRLRIMLESEHITDHAEGRRLFDQGRQEARRATA
jgi:hypothetical protein